MEGNVEERKFSARKQTAEHSSPKANEVFLKAKFGNESNGRKKKW